jgi:hypothetical protein
LILAALFAIPKDDKGRPVWIGILCIMRVYVEISYAWTHTWWHRFFSSVSQSASQNIPEKNTEIQMVWWDDLPDGGRAYQKDHSQNWVLLRMYQSLLSGLRQWSHPQRVQGHQSLMACRRLHHSVGDKRAWRVALLCVERGTPSSWHRHVVSACDCLPGPAIGVVCSSLQCSKKEDPFDWHSPTRYPNLLLHYHFRAEPPWCSAATFLRGKGCETSRWGCETSNHHCYSLQYTPIIMYIQRLSFPNNMPRLEDHA